MPRAIRSRARTAASTISAEPLHALPFFPEAACRRAAAWRVLLAATACVLLSTGSIAAPARGWQGQVTHVTDGDTVWVRPARGGAPRKLRLRGIDAPESCQPHGAVARRALAARLHDQPVRVRGRQRDDYQRLLARVSTPADPDVGAWLVAQGHAWSYRQGRRAGPYAREEAQARAAGRGLWALPGAMEPRLFRRSHGPCR